MGRIFFFLDLAMQIKHFCSIVCFLYGFELNFQGDGLNMVHIAVRLICAL